MSTLVRYTPQDRVLDLANLSRSDYDLISSLHGALVHGQGTLICLQSSASDAAAEMYIRFFRRKYWAVHFPGGAHGAHEIALETDEHRRQKDYWHRAAEDAGYRASKEFHTGGGTVLDVAIDGPRRTGIEVQHSFITIKLAKSRTTKSYRAGWLPVWFLDSDKTPPWFHHVPALGCNRISWGDLPPRRAATALGLTQFTPLKCTVGAFDACPAGRKRPCGKWHPKREPWGGLTVDDVAAMVPAEQILAMRDAKGDVHLVSPESLDLYGGLTGLTGEYAPRTSGPRGNTASHTTQCVNPIHDRQTPTRCACGQQIYPLAQLVRVRDDLCEACRIKLGVPAPRIPS
jgi:hypothetical protein